MRTLKFEILLISECSSASSRVLSIRIFQSESSSSEASNHSNEPDDLADRTKMHENGTARYEATSAERPTNGMTNRFANVCTVRTLIVLAFCAPSGQRSDLEGIRLFATDAD